MAITFQEKFRRDTVRRGKCIIWTAGKNKDGYGLIHDPKNNKTRLAHIVAFELNKGMVPIGLCVCHKCDVPSCVNPAHLFLGTNRDNTQDMLRKGRRKRSRRDDGHHATKILHSERKIIRKRYGAGGISQRALAREYGVSQALISFVCVGAGSYSPKTEKLAKKRLWEK